MSLKFEKRLRVHAKENATKLKPRWKKNPKKQAHTHNHAVAEPPAAPSAEATEEAKNNGVAATTKEPVEGVNSGTGETPPTLGTDKETNPQGTEPNTSAEAEGADTQGVE
jgi:hypothetical protein